MKFEKVVRGGRIFDGHNTYLADVGISEGKIAAVAPDLPAGEARVIDASGKQVLPAGIDAHTHFNLELPLLGIKSRDDYWTGGRAAAHGGLTSVLDFSEQQEGEPLLAGVERKIENQIKGVSPIDYGLHPTVYDWRPELLEEFEVLVEEGFPTVKMFMIYSGEGWRAEEPALLEAMKKADEVGATVLVHCENDALLDHYTRKVVDSGTEVGAYGLALSRPNVVEATAVRRAVDLCEHVDGRLYVVHLSTRQGAEAVARARERDVEVFVETCPQFLTLTDEKLKGEDGHLYGAAPQLKSKRDNEALWAALEDGAVDIVGTDNCTFNREQKELWDGDFREIPRGLPGTETLFPLMYTTGYRRRGWPLNRVVRKTSMNPARIHGLYPEKGSLIPGTDADLIVVDPEKSIEVTPANLETDCDWSPYEGENLYGFPEYTLCRGRELVSDGEIQPEIKGHGRLVERAPGGTLEV